MISDNWLYPKGDMFGFYGKDLWYGFCEANPELYKIIMTLCSLYTNNDSTDPILRSSAHIEHKYYRISCLLGLAEWPDVQG